MGRLNDRDDQGYSLSNYSRKDHETTNYQILNVSDSYFSRVAFLILGKSLPKNTKVALYNNTAKDSR